jgi:hypothetical protein
MLSILVAVNLVAVLDGEPSGMWDLYRISDTAAYTISRQYDGPWLTGSARNFPVRRIDGELVVYSVTTGYRGSFGAAVTIDSAGRVGRIAFDENDGKVSRYRRRRVPEIEDSRFLSQFIGRKLNEIPGPYDISSPAGGAGQHRAEFGRIVRGLIVEALVVAQEARNEGAQNNRDDRR